MKKLSLIFLAVFVAACTSETQYGPCIGLFDEKDPELVYKAKAWNIGMGILFFGLVIPPVVVIVDETFCPVAKK